jgi:hypothetical protein
MMMGLDVREATLEPLLKVHHRLVGPGAAFSCEVGGCRTPATGVYFELNGVVLLPEERAEVIWTLKWIGKIPSRNTVGIRITRAWFHREGNVWLMERSESILQT